MDLDPDAGARLYRERMARMGRPPGWVDPAVRDDERRRPPADVWADRRDICSACPHLEPALDICKACHCGGLRRKISTASESCPLDKWPAV